MASGKRQEIDALLTKRDLNECPSAGSNVSPAGSLANRRHSVEAHSSSEPRPRLIPLVLFAKRLA